MFILKNIFNVNIKKLIFNKKNLIFLKNTFLTCF
jgi:hypothetical protein